MHHALDVEPGDVGDAVLAQCRADVARRLPVIFLGGARCHAACRDARWDVLGEEPVQPIVHGRRFARYLPASQRIAFAGADAGQFGSGPLASFSQGYLGSAREDHAATASVCAVVQHKRLRASGVDANAQAFQLRVPQVALLRAGPGLSDDALG